MATSNTIKVDGIGPVLFERSKRAKNLNISVRPYKGVRVSVPRGLSFAKAEEYVHAKTTWILKQIDRMKQFEREYETIADNSIEIDRGQAKRKLARRLRGLAAKHGFSCSRVSIRNQRTRWGSCSAKNSISLNMKLVRLPDDLIDYVILHELLHTRERSHNRDFWAKLDRLVDDAKKMDSQLRQYGAGLL